MSGSRLVHLIFGERLWSRLPADVVVRAPSWERLRQVAASVQNLGVRKSSAAFLTLDQELRHWKADSWLAGWQDPEPPPMASVRNVPPADLQRDTLEVLALGLCSMHTSGYVREGAVQELAKLTDPVAIPFLLVRTADWAAQVRDPARAVLHSIVEKRGAAAFAAYAALLERLGESTRSDPALLWRLRVALGSQDSIDAVDAVLSTGHFRERRALLAFSEDWPEQRRIEVAERLLSASDTVVRERAARVLLDRLAGIEHAELLRRLVRDRAARIARLVIETAVADGASPLQEILEDGLFHPAASVRKHAAYHWHAIIRASPADRYRHELLQPDGRHRIALLSLAWCGDRSDASLALRFLNAPSSGVSAASITLLGELDAVGHFDLILDGVLGQDASARSAALRTLQRHAPDIDESRLWPLLEQHPDTALAQGILKALLCCGRWTGLRAILRAYARTELADAADRAFAAWYRRLGRRGGRPAGYEALAIREALAAGGARIPPRVRTAIDAL